MKFVLTTLCLTEIKVKDTKDVIDRADSHIMYFSFVAILF